MEVTEAYLERIQSLDSILRAFVTVTADAALVSAKRSEQELVKGERLGPMHGIPVAVKDQIYTNGVLTTGGSPSSMILCHRLMPLSSKT